LVFFTQNIFLATPTLGKKDNRQVSMQIAQQADHFLYR